jgi:cation-transporting ATPase E
VPIALITATERVRPDAKEIIAYFKDSGVHVQIVSGDNEATVRSIGAMVGVEDVVGRALPETKLSIVKALKSSGRVVAMTGDGVNDMLALKEADLGIAMGNATSASKAVANLVLIDSQFSKLPNVIMEGRRIISNIERVASLFLVKTFYSIGLTLVTILSVGAYPFLPRHLTIISALTIGIPAFLLSLPPNNKKYEPGFMHRVLRFSLPFGVLATITVTIARMLFTGPVYSVVALFLVAFTVLTIKARPLRSWRGGLLIAVLVAFILLISIPATHEFFGL